MNDTIEKELKRLELLLALALVKHDGMVQTVREINVVGELMSAELDRLRTEVAENRGVVTSASLLLAGLAARIRSLLGDQAALAELANELDLNTAGLAAAVAENTVP
jgi:hypothetical protein